MNKDENETIIIYLCSHLGYKYKCIIIYEYDLTTNTKFIGTFYIGHPKTSVEEACVTISVVFPDIISPVFANSSVAKLNLIKYFGTCSENKSLPHGERTTDIIYTSMSLVKQMCPFVKEFKLNDVSTILHISYLIQNQRSWYEARYNAYLKEPYYVDYMKRLLDCMSAVLPRFEIFSCIFIKDTTEIIKNELCSVYSEGDTLKDFFKKLYKKYGENMSCILLYSWIRDFIKSVDLLGYILPDNWYISVDTIPIYNFNHCSHSFYLPF
jgi:hypothetical protein